jgi:hypothetical protein
MCIIMSRTMNLLIMFVLSCAILMRALLRLSLLVRLLPMGVSFSINELSHRIF